MSSRGIHGSAGRCATRAVAAALSRRVEEEAGGVAGECKPWPDGFETAKTADGGAGRQRPAAGNATRSSYSTAEVDARALRA